jgi:hypothetical protein
LLQPCRTGRPWISHPRHKPSTASSRIKQGEAHEASGGAPRMPLFVTTIIANEAFVQQGRLRATSA